MASQGANIGGVQGEGEGGVQEGGGGGERGVPTLHKDIFTWVPPKNSGVLKLCVQHVNGTRIKFKLDTSYPAFLLGIHGLYLEPPGSKDCKLNMFNINKLSIALQEHLIQHWFSVKNRTKDPDTIERKSKELWKHEYNKIIHENLDCDWSEEDYFSFTLYWFIDLLADLEKALKLSTDPRSRKFDVRDFVYSMEHLGYGKPLVTAWKDFTQKGNPQFLNEIFFYATYTEPHYYRDPTEQPTYNESQPIYIAGAGSSSSGAGSSSS